MLLSQNTKIDSTTFSVRAFDFMMKDLQNCDSLKLRYKDLRLKVGTFADVNLMLLQKNDSLDKLEIKKTIEIKSLNKELKTLNSKKGISTLEGILIGIGALGIGLAF